MSSRKIRHGGQMRKASEIISRTKKYKYNSSGSLVEITGAVTLGDNEFAVNGSKSSLRRIADLERNVTLLINKFTTDGETDSDTDFDDKVNNSILFKKDVKLGNSSDDEIDVAGHLDIQNGLTLGSTAAGVIDARIDTKIDALVDSAPGALNTLNELSAALGDDADFAGTMTASLNGKLSLTGGTMSGDINMGGNDITNAGTFFGKATTAEYADLAERYEADAEYEEGTVMMFGGEKEVTCAEGHGIDKLAGVVSMKPAYLMNEGAGDNATHPAIALQGRVPVKVVGKVAKGDIMVAADHKGHATAWKEDHDPKMTAYIGIAIKDKIEEGEGMVEVKVGK